MAFIWSDMITMMFGLLTKAPFLVGWSTLANQRTCPTRMRAYPAPQLGLFRDIVPVWIRQGHRPVPDLRCERRPRRLLGDIVLLRFWEGHRARILGHDAPVSETKLHVRESTGM